MLFNIQHSDTTTPTSTSSSEDEGVKDWHEQKIIANDSCLMSLVKFCQFTNLEHSIRGKSKSLDAVL
ncbi:hypothetical protein JOB18_022206 [Solea senegalensis]|uniref:Uncharacterized protein n=1 Tax=Solea senegalensis TaxID=28829 RepID=A0AAV6Q3P9_SOLSE|nr:hypothetical protein JOB18_022206 [Solea senegalensis]